MSPPIRRRTAVALALTASLALAPAARAGDSRVLGLWEPRATAEALLNQAWSWLTRLWTADSTTPPPDPGSDGDHRCTIDPNGTGCIGTCPVGTPPGTPGCP